MSHRRLCRRGGSTVFWIQEVRWVKIKNPLFSGWEWRRSQHPRSSYHKPFIIFSVKGCELLLPSVWALLFILFSCYLELPWTLWASCSDGNVHSGHVFHVRVILICPGLWLWSLGALPGLGFNSNVGDTLWRFSSPQARLLLTELARSRSLLSFICWKWAT